MRTRLSLALAALVLSACGSDSSTAVNQHLSVTAQTFGAIGPSPGASDLASPVAGTAAGTVRITGTMALPDPCYTMGAIVTSDRSFIIVEVTAEHTSGGCPTVLSAVSYDLTVGGAAPGTYTVDVRHETTKGLVTTTQEAALTSVTVH